MNPEQSYGAHSAQVEMQLIVNGGSVGITHMGRDFVLVETPGDHPPCEASILMRVDNSENQWKVRLPEGMSKLSNRVALALSETG